MTEVNDPDNRTVTFEERPGHHVLTDDVIGLCDCSNASALEDAVRSKSDMDEEKLAESEIENDEVCPKCDDEGAAVDEDATNKQENNANEGVAAAKKILEENDEFTNEGEKQHLKEVSKQLTKCIRDKKRYNEFLKSSEVSRTYPALNQRRRECLFPESKTTTVIQSHRE